VPKNWENTFLSGCAISSRGAFRASYGGAHQIPAWFGPDGQAFVAYDEAEAQSQAQAKYGKVVE